MPTPSVSSNQPNIGEHPRLALISVNRVPTGAQITLEAPLFEDFFRTLAGDETPRLTEDAAGNTYYNPTNLPTVDGADLLSIDSRNLLANNRVNITFLRAVGVRTRKTFLVPTVLSNRQIHDYARLFQQAAVRLYAEYMQPASCEIDMVINTVRTPIPEMQLVS